MCIGQWISCRPPGEVRVLALASWAGIISALINGVSSLLYVLIVLLQCHAFEVMDAWKIEAFQSSRFWSVTVACTGQWSDWNALFWELKILQCHPMGTWGRSVCLKTWQDIWLFMLIGSFLLQFFSVALVHFSEQKLNFQNYLFNLHII